MQNVSLIDGSTYISFRNSSLQILTMPQLILLLGVAR